MTVLFQWIPLAWYSLTVQNCGLKHRLFHFIRCICIAVNVVFLTDSVKLLIGILGEYSMNEL